MNLENQVIQSAITQLQAKVSECFTLEESMNASLVLGVIDRLLVSFLSIMLPDQLDKQLTVLNQVHDNVISQLLNITGGNNKLNLIKSKGLCLEDTCSAIAICQGYCRRHYQIKRLSGEITTKSRTNLICSECSVKATYINPPLCAKHYHKKWRDLGRSRVMCSIGSCNKFIHAKGLCSYHYQQLRRKK